MKWNDDVTNLEGTENPTGGESVESEGQGTTTTGTEGARAEGTDAGGVSAGSVSASGDKPEERKPLGVGRERQPIQQARVDCRDCDSGCRSKRKEADVSRSQTGAVQRLCDHLLAQLEADTGEDGVRSLPAA